MRQRWFWSNISDVFILYLWVRLREWGVYDVKRLHNAYWRIRLHQRIIRKLEHKARFFLVAPSAAMGVYSQQSLQNASLRFILSDWSIVQLAKKRFGLSCSSCTVTGGSFSSYLQQSSFRCSDICSTQTTVRDSSLEFSFLTLLIID